MGAVLTFPHSETGVTLYALVFHSDGKVRDVVTPEWESYATLSLGDYDVALTELGTASRVYQFNVPASLAAGVYTVAIFKRAGGAPAEGDPRVGMGAFDYNGTDIIAQAQLADSVTHGGATAKLRLGSTTTTIPFHVTSSEQTTPAVRWHGSGGVANGVEFQSNSALGLLVFGAAGDIQANITGNISGSVGSVATGGITAASIANGAIDAATFAADVDAEILSYLVDDSTRIDASALNTASAAVGSNGSGLTEAGGTGDHLTAIPWNASWDAEVQSEVDDALIANGLDHLVFASVAGADVADNSIIAKLVSKSATADWDSFVNTTDALEAIRDRGDSAWITSTFSITAAAMAAAIASQVRTELTTELGRIDVATSTRMATFTLPTNFAALGINVSGHVSRVTLVDTTTANADMRGTDSAALASVCTETRLAELDAGNLPTDVAAVKSDTAAILLDTGTDGVVVATASKTGYALSATGLDSISADTPNGVASTFATKMMQLWARFFGRVTKDSSAIKTYRSDGTTAATTQTYTSSGDDDDIGAAT